MVNSAAGSGPLESTAADAGGGVLAFAVRDGGLYERLGALLPALRIERVDPDGALAERVKLGHFSLVLLGPGDDEAGDRALTARIKATARGRATPLVLRTRRALPAALRDGCLAGADEVLAADAAPELLALRLHMLQRLCEAHDSAFGGSGTASLDRLVHEHLEALAHERGLSTREREVLSLLVLGRTPQDIGVALGISPRTAKFHQGNVLTKLGAESKFDLVRLLF